MIRLTYVSVILLVFFAGCVSTSKRYDKANKLEQEGRYLEACNQYIRILQKDRDFTQASDRLRIAGPFVIEDYQAESEGFEGSGDYLRAVDALDAMESFAQRTQNVGVVLQLPEGYTERRRGLSEKAVTALVTEAESLLADGQFNNALRAYERAQELPSVSDAEYEEFEEAKARIFIRWSRYEMDSGHYRAAFDRAASAIELAGPASPLGEEAIELQEMALFEGTHNVVFLEFRQTESVERNAPRYLLDDLNDRLVLDYWSVPPPFIAYADPTEVRRVTRRIVSSSTRVIDRADAIAVGREMDADFVISGELVSYVDEERRVRERTRSARTKGRNPLDTTYVLRSYTLDLKTEMEYRLFDVRARKSIYSSSAKESVSRKLERGVYNGDYRDLDLSSRDRDLFDEVELDRQIQEMEEELSDKLAKKIADKVFDRVLSQIE